MQKRSVPLNSYSDSSQMPKILVVGGSGLIGQNLSSCLSRNFDIEILDRNINDKFLTYAIDIYNQKEVKKIFLNNKYSTVLHLLGSRNNQDADYDFEQSFKKNVLSLSNIVENCPRDTKIIFISSASVYGNAKSPMGENTSPTPVNIYGILKYLSELLLIKMANERKLNYVILRCFSIYNGLNNRLIIGKLYSSLINMKDITVYNPDQLRDYIHISDLCKIIDSIINNDKIKNTILNVGSGKGIAISEIISLFSGYMKSSIFTESRGNGVDAVAKVEKLKSLVSFEPKDVIKAIKFDLGQLNL